MRLLFHLCMRTARKLIACHNPLTLRLPFPLPLASPDCIISRRETREEEVRISSPTTACPPVHFLRKKISSPFHKFVLTTLSNPFSGFALPVRKRARARARDGAELCGACLYRRCSPLLGRRARRHGEAGRPATLYSPIAIIEVPLGFTEVCAVKRENGGKGEVAEDEEEEEEEWAS